MCNATTKQNETTETKSYAISIYRLLWITVSRETRARARARSMNSKRGVRVATIRVIPAERARVLPPSLKVREGLRLSPRPLQQASSGVGALPLRGVASVASSWRRLVRLLRCLLGAARCSNRRCCAVNFSSMTSVDPLVSCISAPLSVFALLLGILFFIPRRFCFRVTRRRVAADQTRVVGSCLRFNFSVRSRSVETKRTRARAHVCCRYTR